MTIKQKQCLLAYLGFYHGAIDGIWGSGSELAQQEFRAAYGAADLLDAVCGKAEPADAGDFWEEIRFFKREEFRCKCGGAFCGGFPAEPDERLVRLADRVRAHFGAAMTVSSGVRCETHNANVGGVAASRHLRGKAMDFRVAGHSAREVLGFVQAQAEVRYAYAIDGSFVHMDVE